MNNLTMIYSYYNGLTNIFIRVYYLSIKTWGFPKFLFIYKQV